MGGAATERRPKGQAPIAASWSPESSRAPLRGGARRTGDEKAATCASRRPGAARQGAPAGSAPPEAGPSVLAAHEKAASWRPSGQPAEAAVSGTSSKAPHRPPKAADGFTGDGATPWGGGHAGQPVSGVMAPSRGRLGLP